MHLRVPLWSVPFLRAAEPIAQDLSQLQVADRRTVGERQEAFAGCIVRAHRLDVQVSHVAHVGDTEALARDDGDRPVQHRLDHLQ